MTEITLEELVQAIIEDNKVPALVDAAENVVIAWGMGWDMAGVMDVLADVLEMG